MACVYLKCRCTGTCGTPSPPASRNDAAKSFFPVSEAQKRAWASSCASLWRISSLPQWHSRHHRSYFRTRGVGLASHTSVSPVGLRRSHRLRLTTAVSPSPAHAHIA